jgi:hypothetical protein
MKKPLFLPLFLIMVFNSHGQELRKFSFQYNMGSTLSIPYKKTIELFPDFEGHPQTEYFSRFSYFIEGQFSYWFNQRLSVNTGLNFNINRLGIIDKIGLQTNTGEVESSYFTIPLLVNYHFKNKIAVSAGPFFSILNNAKEFGTSVTDTSKFNFYDSHDPAILSQDFNYEYDSEIKKNLSPIDYGLSVQIDYTFNISKRISAVILSRFNYGLNDIIVDFQQRNTATVWKNYSLLFGAGIKYH